MKDLTRKLCMIAGIIVTISMVMIACDDSTDDSTEKVDVTPPPTVNYRKPLYVLENFNKTKIHLLEDKFVSFTEFTPPIIIKKDLKKIISFQVTYENSSNNNYPKEVYPEISSSENIVIVETEIDEDFSVIYYSCLVLMPDCGIGWLECTAGDHKRRTYVYCAAEMVKNGTWAGSGVRLTEFSTPEYFVNSSKESKTTTILYLYASESKTNYDESYINAFINGEELVDSFSFPSTNTYDFMNLTNIHIFSYDSDYKPSKIKFKGKSGDYSAYMGYVFAWGN